MANPARLHVLRLSLAAALYGAFGVTALAGDQPLQPHGTVTGFIVGLRQTVSESGARVLDEAAQWLAKFEFAAPKGDLRPGSHALALQTTGHDAIPLGARTVTLTDSADSTIATASRSSHLTLQALADATVASSDRGWSFGHARSNLGAEIGDTALDPSTYLAANITHGPAIGGALAEQSLGGHDIELGLPMPAFPDTHITAARYWWGDRAFMPEVQGYRLGLSYDLNQHLQFEGGRSEDQIHGVAEFFGLRYTLPLDTKRPPGVMLP